MSLSRRYFLMLAAAATGRASGADDFWNRKLASEWTTGEIYRLLNASPWAVTVDAVGIKFDPKDGEPAAQRIWGPKCVVTWESARAVRDARKSALPDTFAGCHVIGVDGIPVGPPGSLRRVRQFTQLQSKGRKSWSAHPTVSRTVTSTSAVFLFGFPYDSTPIDPDTGDLVFKTQFGNVMVQAKFRPRNMVYRGQLAV